VTAGLSSPGRVRTVLEGAKGGILVGNRQLSDNGQRQLVSSPVLLTKSIWPELLLGGSPDGQKKHVNLDVSFHSCSIHARLLCKGGFCANNFSLRLTPFRGLSKVHLVTDAGGPWVGLLSPCSEAGIRSLKKALFGHWPGAEVGEVRQEP
jgi:hypothetical protein